jgi:hypothetical protein
LKEYGFTIIVSDMQDAPLPAIPDKPVIFITSQHPSCSSAVFRLHWGQDLPYSNYIAPLEIIQRLQPACSVFVPHDLEAPIRLDELAYMSAFDIYCAPSSDFNPMLRHACQVVPAGWVKHNHFDELASEIQSMVTKKGTFFINQVVQLMQTGGAEFIQKNYPQIFADQIPVKLPIWPGCIELGERLRQYGAALIPAETISTKLIAASPRIYVNAPGSVIAEAQYLNTPVTLVGADGVADRPIVPVAPSSAKPKFDFGGLLGSIAHHIEAHR